jgi:c-di-GMP-binding flagellar brake protein YcgR
MKERRTYIRFDSQDYVIIRPENDASPAVKADLVDISFSGVGVYSNEKISSNTKVKVELVTKLWDKPIVGEGKVVHAVEVHKYNKDVFRIGIEFVNIDKDAIQGIINLIQSDICQEAKRKKKF